MLGPIRQLKGFPGDSDVKNLPVNAGGAGLITVGGTGNPLQNSDLGNPMNRGAWRAASIVAKELDITWQLNNNN